MSISRPVFSLFFVAAFAAVFWAWLASGEIAHVESGPQAPTEDPSPTGAWPMKADLPTLEVGSRPEDQLLLPDGTRLPVLNGAYGAPPPKWPEDRPWSPIVRKEIDKLGYEWYVHADGCKTITQVVFDRVSGKRMVATNTFQPTDPLPIRREEGEKVRKKK